MFVCCRLLNLCVVNVHLRGLGNRVLQFSYVVPKRKRKSQKKGSREDTCWTVAQTSTSDSPSGLDKTDLSTESSAVQTRINSQTRFEKPLTLPTADNCGQFKRSICTVPDTGSFVVLVNLVCLANKVSISKLSEIVSSTTLFTVSSCEETCLGKLPSVLFPRVDTVKNERVEYCLDSPVSCNQEIPCRECWVFFNSQAVQDHKRVNTEEGVLWFDETVLDQEVLY